MSQNPYITQHYGGSLEFFHSVRRGSHDDSEWDATTGFTRFPNAQHMKCTVFKPSKPSPPKQTESPAQTPPNNTFRLRLRNGLSPDPFPSRPTTPGSTTGLPPLMPSSHSQSVSTPREANDARQPAPEDDEIPQQPHQQQQEQPSSTLAPAPAAHPDDLSPTLSPMQFPHTPRPLPPSMSPLPTAAVTVAPHKPAQAPGDKRVPPDVSFATPPELRSPPRPAATTPAHTSSEDAGGKGGVSHDDTPCSSSTVTAATGDGPEPPRAVAVPVSAAAPDDVLQRSRAALAQAQRLLEEEESAAADELGVIVSPLDPDVPAQEPHLAPPPPLPPLPMVSSAVGVVSPSFALSAPLSSPAQDVLGDAADASSPAGEEGARSSGYVSPFSDLSPGQYPGSSPALSTGQGASEQEVPQVRCAERPARMTENAAITRLLLTLPQNPVQLATRRLLRRQPPPTARANGSGLGHGDNGVTRIVETKVTVSPVKSSHRSPQRPQLAPADGHLRPQNSPSKPSHNPEESTVSPEALERLLSQLGYFLQHSSRTEAAPHPGQRRPLPLHSASSGVRQTPTKRRPSSAHLAANTTPTSARAGSDVLLVTPPPPTVLVGRRPRTGERGVAPVGSAAHGPSPGRVRHDAPRSAALPSYAQPTVSWLSRLSEEERTTAGGQFTADGTQRVVMLESDVVVLTPRAQPF